MSELDLDIECPFCHEKGFDLIGLKIHIENYCEIYAITPVVDKRPNDLKTQDGNR
jgi:hypothetical protein